jgi:hypothetical protein
MKKVLIFIVLFGFNCAILFGSSSKEKITEELASIEGEWKADWILIDTGEVFFPTYIFTGNQFEINYPEGYYYGTFSYTKNKITFTNENPETKANFTVMSLTYELIGYTRIKFTINGRNLWFTKQPYFDIEYNLRTNESERNNFPVNQSESISIQGLWIAAYTNDGRRPSYNFTGNVFTLTVNNRNPITGTIKINDNILVLFVDNEIFGIYVYEFQFGSVLNLHELFGQNDSWWGAFYNEEAVANFPINQTELAGIQGSWRMPGLWRVTYTFSGDGFTLSRKLSPYPSFVSGKVKINDNILIFLVDNMVVGIFRYEYQLDNILYLDDIPGGAGSVQTHKGAFTKQ